jgi:hypothetical protein
MRTDVLEYRYGEGLRVDNATKLPGRVASTVGSEILYLGYHFRTATRGTNRFDIYFGGSISVY